VFPSIQEGNSAAKRSRKHYFHKYIKRMPDEEILKTVDFEGIVKLV
jgi:hypothetical protein